MSDGIRVDIRLLPESLKNDARGCRPVLVLSDVGSAPGKDEAVFNIVDKDLTPRQRWLLARAMTEPLWGTLKGGKKTKPLPYLVGWTVMLKWPNGASRETTVIARSRSQARYLAIKRYLTPPDGSVLSGHGSFRAALQSMKVLAKRCRMIDQVIDQSAGPQIVLVGGGGT